jgi:hypothetical protein
MKRLILCLMILLLAPLALAADAPATAPATKGSQHATIEPGLYWNLVRAEQFGLGIPNKWTNRPNRANMVLHLAMSGIKDETRQPLDLGLTVERLTKPSDSLDDEAKKLIQRYNQEKSITVEGKPTAEHVKLADGNDSVLVTLSMLAGNRRTLMQKLLVNGKEHRWVVSAYVTAGEKSVLTDRDRDMGQKLRAHLLSFTLDPKNIDQTPLNKAYLTPAQHKPPASQPAT